jgi:hypothetical protein
MGILGGYFTCPPRFEWAIRRLPPLRRCLLGIDWTQDCNDEKSRELSEATSHFISFNWKSG